VFLGGRIENLQDALTHASGYNFYNTSRFDFAKLLADPNNMAANLRAYINDFSGNVQDILEKFSFREEIERLDSANLLYLIVQKFGEIDLHPNVVSNHEMGYVFEELIRRFSEQSNETAGEQFTPREVIRLMVNLLFSPDAEALGQKGVVRTVYDPACGTGGMLTVAKERVLDAINPDAYIELFGQELNPKSYAVCKADMLIKGESDQNIKQGNSFSEDYLKGRHFDYMLSNPPYGVEWKKVEKAVRDEAKRGYAGRFGAGLPRINDGSFLFLQHLISKMHAAEDGGSRIAIVFNASPLFTGDAGSGESEIRRWIIENDCLEAIVALPDQLFYNTGIFTYVWIVTNRKEERRQGRIQLINAVSFYQKMRRSLGNKRNFIADDQIAEITAIYSAFEEGRYSKIFDNADFGYRRITVERPLRQNYRADSERVERLAASPAFQKALRQKPTPVQQLSLDGAALDSEGERPILSALSSMNGALYCDRPSFERALTAAFAAAGVPLSSPLQAAIVNGLAEQDETAEPIPGKGGLPEPDPELRDTENVPLKEDIQSYFAREVLPHVPDAWINEKVRDEKDGDSGRVGYEIPFTRHFYEFKPPRPLEMIDAEIQELEREIVAMLQEVTA
jgi:type I restriction enzyme M protein